jgi:hypothetical protein
VAVHSPAVGKVGQRRLEGGDTKGSYAGNWVTP